MTKPIKNPGSLKGRSPQPTPPSFFIFTSSECSLTALRRDARIPAALTSLSALPTRLPIPVNAHKGEWLSSGFFFFLSLYLIHLPLLSLPARSMAPFVSDSTRGSADSELTSESLKCSVTPRTKEANWIFSPEKIPFPLPFLVLSWLYMHDQGTVNERLLPPHSAHISTHFFKWFIEFLPGVEHFCFGPSCFWRHFCVFSDIELPCTTSWCHRKQWEADIYNWSIPAMPNGLFAVSPTKVYFTWPSGTESVENNTTYTLLLPVIF